jgi:MFS family permease
MATLFRLLRLAAVDIGPLQRYRDFRLLFIGQVVSVFGAAIRRVAMPYQIYALTHSSLAVGLLGLFAIVPILLLALLGGALADARDRRRMVQLTEIGMAGLSGLLLANALLPHPALWIIYAVQAAGAGLDSLQTPALNAMLPRLVEREDLPATGAINELAYNLGSVAGPALAGASIALLGLPGTYGIDIATFAVSLAALKAIRAVPPPPDAERPSLRRILEGLRYARSRPDLLGTYFVDMVALFFGMPMALFPAIATRFGGAGVLGLLYAAPSVGEFLAVLTSGWVRHVHRHGMAIIIAAGAWGAAVIGFGLAPSLPVALISLALAGGADQISGIFRGVIWNQSIPDTLRGRLAGIELISYASGPALGNLEAGAVATTFNVEASVVSGGILCVIGVAALALVLPGLRRYDNRTTLARR